MAIITCWAAEDLIMLTHLPLVRVHAPMYRVSIDSDNGLSLSRRKAIIQTNAGLLSIWPSGTTFSEILIKIQNFLFIKVRPKISSVKWRPLGPGVNELNRKVQINNENITMMYPMELCDALFTASLFTLLWLLFIQAPCLRIIFHWHWAKLSSAGVFTHW